MLRPASPSPTFSIIDDDFARRLSTNPHPNVQIELLKRVLNSELKTVAKHNLIAERKFSEMLERAMRSYTTRSLDTAQVIAELVELAKQMCAERDRGAKLEFVQPTCGCPPRWAERSEPAE
jgi:type I restriction enzyme R subunit